MMVLKIAQRPRPGFMPGCHRSARFPERNAHAGKGPRAARGPWWRRAQRALPCRVCYDGKNNGRPFLSRSRVQPLSLFSGPVVSAPLRVPRAPRRVSGREEQGSAGAAAGRQVGRAGARRPAATDAPESRCAWPVAPLHHDGAPKQRSAARLREASEIGSVGKSAPPLFRCAGCARQLTAPFGRGRVTYALSNLTY